MKYILVVDDDKTNLIAAQKALNATYRVMPVLSGKQALKYLESNPCDLILLDINMPEMDGFETMQRIREDERFAQIPIIFLTGDNDAQTESRCLESGAMDFITKPFVPAVMLSRIGRILELEDMRRQLADKLEKKIKEVEDIESKSKHDVLTGLWNRAYTESRVNELVENGSTGVLFMIDMDNFKAINDNYGHIEGDNILKAFADTMRKFSSEKDILCRIGGDEFIMYIDGMTSKSAIRNRASDIISDLCRKIEEKKYETNTSVSIGIAQIPEDGNDFQTVYNAADKALYYVKQNGKNSYHFFSEQKAEESARGSSLVDLDYLRALMARKDSGKGSYHLDLDSFHHVYNFIRRFVERNSREVQMVLFTVGTEDNTDQSEIEVALEMLEQAIATSLRRVDVSTRYSGKQIIVVLMDANLQNGEMVAERVIHCFEKLYVGNKIKLRYNVAGVEGKY